MGGTKRGAGPGGQCVCPSCGATSPHQIGVPCTSVSCPKCGAKMVR
jgi:transposase